MALKGQMAIQENIPLGADAKIEFVNVAGKGILKGITLRTDNTADTSILQIIIDGQLSEFNTITNSVWGNNSGNGIWVVTSSRYGQLTLNLPFVSGFSIAIRKQGASPGSYNGTVLWAVEV